MTPGTRSLATILKLWKMSNLGKWNVTNFRVTDTPYWTATFTIPGLSHESFDIDGNPKMTSVMLTSVMSRIYTLHRPNPKTGSVFLDWDTLTQDRLSFVSSTEFQLSPALYQKEVAKWPLDVKFSLGAVGNSSLCNIIQFYVPGKEEDPLWINITQMVSVDRSTRRPSPLPDWFKDKYKGKGVFDKGLIIKPFERPPNTYSHPTFVNWSDTDNYHHTNFSSYVRFALDSLHAALRIHEGKGDDQVKVSTDSDETEEKPLKGISKEIVAHGLKNVRICYLTESLEGQSLATHVWQVSDQPHVVWASIERDDKAICQMKLEYF